MKPEPKSLQQAIVYFSDPDNCIAYLAARRWPNGVTCPTCGSESVKFNAGRRIWQCASHHPKRQFSIKVGTIYEDSAIPLDKWMTATWMLTNCKNGISSYEIARDLQVTQKTAWFMLHRIRLALQDESFGKVGGNGAPVEVDETFIGGKARFMHKDVKARRISRPGRNIGDKILVMGIMERGGRVRTQVIPHRRKHMVVPIVREHVEAGATIYTDELPSYNRLGGEYAHEVINHAEQYVRGKVHTNGMENFWSLVKRGLHGTYVSVEPFHLFRYLDEQVFRYSNRATKQRKVTDADRFNLAISKIVGKRLTFASLTGKVAAAEAF